MITYQVDDLDRKIIDRLTAVSRSMILRSRSSTW